MSGLLAMASTSLRAQEPPTPSPRDEVGPAAVAPDTVRGELGQDAGFRFLGRPSPRQRVIGGVWTLHPYAVSFPRLEETRGYGVQWRGYFAATFVNSYGERAFSAGVERVWGSLAWKALGAGVGYRAGLVTGYDERMLAVAGDLPALPFIGLMAWTRVGPTRFDAFYVYRVVTLELSLKL